ncbi:MAG: hypothetical protein ABH854_00475 [Candidatus Diapherotrites archaeon]|nr:hypothetical protein [Candidatus Micrarchaeota archaeon]MBU1940078.1 hypothetical protein [Candidatus Micrarchaeota archaeon]
MDYDEIRRIHRLEKSSSRLVELNQDFYNDLNVFMQHEKTEYLDSLKDFSISKTRNFTNLKKMIEEIFSLREKKIVSLALVASRTNESSDTNMALPEKATFNAILAVLTKHNEMLTSLFTTKGAKKAKAKSTDLNLAKLKVSVDIPSFVGTDMKEYGPYSANETVELPYNIAKLLSTRKMGSIVSG